jgi:hypothetical protein
MSENLGYTYDFLFPDGKRTRFSLELEGDTLNLMPEPQLEYPAWAALEQNKCPNCLLDEGQEPYCPVAVSLLSPVEIFRDSLSYEEAQVTVECPERGYHKNTSLQVGLSSLFGLIMATSGCPSLEKLKPLARFHLPFATSDETVFRVMGAYLLAQYIRQKEGGDPDWDLRYLESMYDSIREVNKHVVERLKNIEALRDASLNALINLDCFAINIKMSIDLSAIEDLRNLFSAYL